VAAGRSSQTTAGRVRKNEVVTAESLSRAVEEFLAGSRAAVVVENGAVAFDLAQAHYSISGEHNKCVLHLWSNERNVVRRVLDIEVGKEVLRLAVQKLGQARPTKIEICRQNDRRTPTAKKAARAAYQRALERMLERRFPGFRIDRLTTAVDLEHSFGPIYARGLIRKGQSAFTVLGVNSQETQASVDAALTFGILWLDACRHAQAAKLHVEGLELFLPRGASRLTRERMAHLDPSAAKWHLWEFDEHEDYAVELDVSDRGNVATRLTHAFDAQAASERFATPISAVRSLMPEVETAMRSVFAAMGWSLRAPGSRKPRNSVGVQNSYSVLAHRNMCSTSKTPQLSSSWCEASAKYGTRKGRAITFCGGCIRNAGWNRW